MKRRDFIKCLGGALGALGAPLTMPLLAKDERRRPNLLFIMTDQQRWDALSCAGNSVLRTPNMDRIANGGVRFDLCHSQCPVCGPARNSLLTGCSIETTGCRTNQDAEIEVKPTRELQTFDQILAASGYVTEYYGKWHSPMHYARNYRNEIFPPSRLVETYRKFRKGRYVHATLREGQLMDSLLQCPYTPNPLDARYASLRDPQKAPTRKLIGADEHGISDLPANMSLTAFQAQDALAALDRLAGGPPFSLTCSFHFPHAPMLPVEPYASMFDPAQMTPPKSIDDPMTNNPYYNGSNRLLLREYSDPKKIKYMIANYYALIKEVDDWVGKILDKLDEHHLSDSTLVIFTSDHGEMLGAHGMREKNNFLEEAVRVPLLMRFPGKIKPGSVVREPVSHCDVFATILDYLGAGNYPSEGSSLRPRVEGKISSDPAFAIAEWNCPGSMQSNLMIRTQDWKLMMPFDPESKYPNALFNLKEDPCELENLIGSNPNRARYREQAENLRQQILNWCEMVRHPKLDGVKKRVLI